MIKKENKKAKANLDDWEQHDDKSNPNKRNYNRIKELVSQGKEGCLQITKEEYETEGLFEPYKVKIDNWRVADGQLPFGDGDLIVDYLKEKYEELYKKRQQEIWGPDGLLGEFKEEPAKDSPEGKEEIRQIQIKNINYCVDKYGKEHENTLKATRAFILEYGHSFEEDKHIFDSVDKKCFHPNHPKVTNKDEF